VDRPWIRHLGPAGFGVWKGDATVRRRATSGASALTVAMLVAHREHPLTNDVVTLAARFGAASVIEHDRIGPDLLDQVFPGKLERTVRHRVGNDDASGKEVINLGC
jgi:hypothetical protein